MSSANEETVEALREACGEAKGTLDHQLNWLQQIDSKAVKILRANILLLGLIFTALSVSIRTDVVDIYQFVNLYTIFGALALVFSGIGAGVTYVASSFEAGLGHRDLINALDDDHDKEELYQNLAQGYSEWIEFNDYVLGFNAYLITFTIITVIDSLALLTAGTAIGILNMAFTEISTIFFVILLIILFAVDYGIIKAEGFVVWYFRTRDGNR